MKPRGRRPPGRLSLPRTAGKPCRRLPVFRARHPVLLVATRAARCAARALHQPWGVHLPAVRGPAAPPAAGQSASHSVRLRLHGGVMKRARRSFESFAALATAGGSAGTEGRRTCPAGDCPPAPPVPLTGGQDFLARPRAKPRDNDSAPRGPLMDLSWTCRRPAVDLTPRRRAGCAGQISLSPAHPRGESHTQMEGFQIEGGSTPYPHIAL